MIVGVSGHVINERQFTVAPSNQLAEAQQFIQLGKKPRNFVFSHEVGTCIPCVSAVRCNPSRHLWVASFQECMMTPFFIKERVTARSSKEAESPACTSGFTMARLGSYVLFLLLLLSQ